MAHTKEPGCPMSITNPACWCDAIRGHRRDDYQPGWQLMDNVWKRMNTQRNAQTLLKEGDLIELSEGHKVYADIPEHFLYANKRGSWKMAHGEAYIKGELAFLAGKYVVVKTATDGGGQTYDGGFPDGHHVWCESVDRKHKVDFYQSGCFTAMITDIKPVGRATLRWVVEDDK